MARARALYPRSFGVALLLAAAGVWLAVGPHGPGRPSYDVREVDLEEAKSMIGLGALVIDVRGEDKFAHRHIPGAVLLPLVVLRAGIPASLEAARDRRIIVYCNEGLSHGPEAAHILNQAGFADAVNLRSGIEGWAKAGLPIERT